MHDRVCAHRARMRVTPSLLLPLGAASLGRWGDLQGLLLVMCVCVRVCAGRRPHGASTSVHLHGVGGAASLLLSIRGEGGGGGGVSAGAWTNVWLWGVRVWVCVSVFVSLCVCVCAVCACVFAGGCARRGGAGSASPAPCRGVRAELIAGSPALLTSGFCGHMGYVLEFKRAYSPRAGAEAAGGCMG